MRVITYWYLPTISSNTKFSPGRTPAVWMFCPWSQLSHIPLWINRDIIQITVTLTNLIAVSVNKTYIMNDRVNAVKLITSLFSGMGDNSTFPGHVSRRIRFLLVDYPQHLCIIYIFVVCSNYCRFCSTSSSKILTLLFKFKLLDCQVTALFRTLVWHTFCQWPFLSHNSEVS